MIEPTTKIKTLQLDEISYRFFTSVKRHKLINSLEKNFHKVKKMSERKEMSDKLQKLSDYEADIKEMFMKKYSFGVPFRKDPLNNECENITNK